MSLSGGHIYGYIFYFVLFSRDNCTEAGARSPYLLDSEYSAWSIFYMTGLYFRTDKPYITLIDFFFFFSPPTPLSIKQEG